MTKLADLQKLTEFEFLKIEEELRLIVEQENRLRTGIRDLKARAWSGESGDVAGMKSLGADIAWRAWVDSTVENMNYDLARVLAQKQACIAKTKRYFSRMESCRSLSKREQSRRASERAKRSLDHAVTQSVLF